MGKPAARIGDMHVCPLQTPGTPPIPHVGGAIVGPGCATVLIGGMPAAVMGDMCTCVGPPDTIILGSAGVFIGGKPAARMGDQCAHGGVITVGLPTVLIGEVDVGGAPAVPLNVLNSLLSNVSGPVKTTIAQVIAFIEAAKYGDLLVHDSTTCAICAKNSQQSS
ncbi:MAG: PAAR domain-containing protein [Ginsengibacter sp.]